MTDEERSKLCSTLRSMYANRWCDCDNEPCDAAADEIERLAAPPRPDASAGLIEAAEIAEEWDSGWGEDRNTGVARQTAIEIAAALRARAADRNGK